MVKCESKIYLLFYFVINPPFQLYHLYSHHLYLPFSPISTSLFSREPRLCKIVCPSVRPSVRQPVGRSDGPYCFRRRAETRRRTTFVVFTNLLISFLSQYLFFFYLFSCLSQFLLSLSLFPFLAYLNFFSFSSDVVRI